MNSCKLDFAHLTALKLHIDQNLSDAVRFPRLRHYRARLQVTLGSWTSSTVAKAASDAPEHALHKMSAFSFGIQSPHGSFGSQILDDLWRRFFAI